MIIDPNEIIVDVKNLKNQLGNKWVHDGLDMQIKRGEIVAIVGDSGGGKTTLLRSLLMLQKPTSGSIKIFGIETTNCTEKQANKIRERWGVMFQSSALFSSLTVWENIALPLKEFCHLPEQTCKEIALLKMSLAGLELDAAYKYPAELSGGMKRRAALARAIALDPELLFLDEPTTGLDPKRAADLDALILHLRRNLALTFVIVTHDMNSLSRLPDRVLFLGEGKILANSPMKELLKSPNPIVQKFFTGVEVPNGL